MNQAAGSEYPAALGGLDHMLAAVERHRSIEYIAGFVIVDMDVTRQGIAGRHGLIEQGQPSFCLYRDGLTLQQSADEQISGALPVGKCVEGVIGLGYHGLPYC